MIKVEVTKAEVEKHFIKGGLGMLPDTIIVEGEPVEDRCRVPGCNKTKFHPKTSHPQPIEELDMEMFDDSEIESSMWIAVLAIARALANKINELIRAHNDK